MNTFEKLDDSDEVNHKNGNKRINARFNLEISNRKENAHHAAVNNLYKYGEKHYKSIFTDEEVENICKMLESGNPVSKIIRELDLENRGSIYSSIDKIINGKTWVRISKKYNIDRKLYHYKTYKYNDIYKMCEYIFESKMKNKEIIKLFPQYDFKKLNTMLKGIRSNRIYKDVIKDYLSSTTRERITISEMI